MLSDTMMLGGGRKAAYPIENSLLFRGTQYLSWTPGVAGNLTTWTFSAWVRRNRLGARQTVFSASADAYGWDVHTVNFAENDTLNFGVAEGTAMAVGETESVFRDPSAWLHVVAVFDTTNPLDGERMQLHVNGMRMSVKKAQSSSAVWPVAKDKPGFINRLNKGHDIGRLAYWPDNQYFAELQIADVRFVDGLALAPTEFGELDRFTGSWRPKKFTHLDTGANSFHLGSAWNAASLGADASGKGNNWKPFSFAATDVVKDSPTNVYATLNPLVAIPSKAAVSNGGLGYKDPNAAYSGVPATLALPSSGIWQAEMTLGQATNSSCAYALGVCREGLDLTAIYRTGFWKISISSGVLAVDGAQARFDHSNSGNTDAANIVAGAKDEVFGMVVDMDSGHAWVGRGGAWYGADGQQNGNPQSGANPTFTIDVSQRLFWFAQAGYVTAPAIYNFGQRPFAHPVARAKGLCTANLPATTGVTSGSFSGNANADGPCVFTGAVPFTLEIKEHPVSWGVHADKLATGFKIRTADALYNGSGTCGWKATYATPPKPTVGPKGRAPANAQRNP